MSDKTAEKVTVEVSLVVPVLNEQELIVVFYEAVADQLSKVVDSFEVVFVDDGSTDGSWLEIQALAKKCNKVKGLRLARNYGKEVALTAGLAHSRGRAHIPIDVDFQDPVDLLPDLIEQWRKGHRHVVAVRSDRSDGWLRGKLSHFFYSGMERLSDGIVTRNAGDYRLLDASVTERLLQFSERGKFNKGLFSLASPVSISILYERPESIRKGKPPQSFSKLADLALLALAGSSTMLAKGVLAFGGFSLFVSILGMVLTTVLRAIGVLAVPGQATTVLLVMIVIAVQALGFGFIGLLVTQIYDEVRQRPLYFVDEEV